MEKQAPETSPVSFLGTGWSFPPEFIKVGPEPKGELTMTSDESDIDASLRILLGTAPGERFLNPKYGLDLHEILFEQLSTTMKTYVKDRINTAILVYEPRINLISVELDSSAQNEGKINILVEYEVRATNSRFNLVYPFFNDNGSEVNNAGYFRSR